MATRYTSLLFSLINVFAPLSAAQAATAPDTAVYAMTGEPASLDPVYPYDASSQGIIFNVYDTLLRFKGSSMTELEPSLSTKVPSAQNGLVSADGLTYRFPIRKNVKFQDGSTLEPEDVRYSLLRFMLTDPPGGPAALLLEPVFGLGSTRGPGGAITLADADIEKAVRVDGDSVVVKLKRPFAPFLSIVARWSYVENRKWCAANGEWDGNLANWRKYNARPQEKSGLFERMNGTGPFMLERWDRSRKAVHLAAFPGYWGAKPRITKAVAATVSEFATRRLMLEAGDADIADVPHTFASQIRGLRGVRLDDNLPRIKTDPVFFMTFDINSVGNPDIGSGQLDGRGIPPNFFSDPDVRKGFSYAFNYEAFLNQTQAGKGLLAEGPVPPGVPGYAKPKNRYTHDPAKARGHFMKAFGGKVWRDGFAFTLSYNTGSEGRQASCEIMKREVEALNPKFHIRLRGIDWPVFLEKAQNRKMPMFSRGWIADYPDAHNFVFPFYHSQGRYASSQGYKNPDMDRLIEQAVAAPAAKRAALYDRIQQLGYEDAPQVFTVHPPGIYAYSEKLKGFTDNPVNMGINFLPLYKAP
ncbi:MAG: ABC transporter substrate-binding protein [Elusimicrobia bacterium]|nr:ABC transporter substrate-binding protein [Elusimicrobiota bacterium]